MAEIQRYENKGSIVMDYIQKRDGYYIVENQKVPNAAAVIKQGVDRGISTYVMYHNADERGVEVVVKARTRDGVEAEEWVRLEYVTEAYKTFLQKMLKRIKRKEITREEVMSTGTIDSPWGKIPAFSSPDLQLEYINHLIRMYSFLPRIAVTKAKNRAILQLLGREFREQEEIEHEEMEIKEVNQQMKEEQPAPTVSENQLKYIHALINDWAKKADVNPEVLKQQIKKQIGVETLKEIDRNQASQLIEALKKKIQSLQTEENEEVIE